MEGPLQQAQSTSSFAAARLEFLRRGSVEKMTGLSRSSIYDLLERGAFPKPVPIGKKAVRWLEHEVQAWMSEKVAHRK